MFDTYVKEALDRLEITFANQCSSQKKKPIFEDVSGRRWRLFLVFTLVASVLFVGFCSFSISRFLEKLEYQKNVSAYLYQEELETTKTPVPLRAFLYPNDGQASYSLRENLPNLSSLSIAEVRFENGQILKIDDPNLRQVRDLIREVKPSLSEYLLVSDFIKGNSSPLLLTQVFNQKKFINQLVDYIESQGFEGLSLDLDWHRLGESEIGKTEALLFILSQRLKQKGLFFEIVTTTSEHDLWGSLAALNEPIMLRLYQRGVKNCSVDCVGLFPIEKLKTDLTRIFHTYPQSNFGLVMPTESYLSKEKTLLETVAYADLGPYLVPGTELIADQTKGGFFYDFNGYKIYVVDAYTWLTLMQAIQKVVANGSYAVVWDGLGRADPATWLIIQEQDNEKRLAILEKHYFQEYKINVEGQGDVWHLREVPLPGHRQVVLDDGELLIQKIYQKESPGHIYRTSNSLDSKTLELTFDDGPSPIVTPKLLDFLAENNIKATFYLIGEKAYEYPKIVERILREGHSIGNHTFSHHNPYLLTLSQFEAELKTTNHIIKSITDKETQLYRPPYMTPIGFWTRRELEQLELLTTLGYEVNFSSIDSRDWEASNSTRIIDTVMSEIEANPQAKQILFHDGLNTSNLSFQALKEIVPLLRERGYSFDQASLQADRFIKEPGFWRTLTNTLASMHFPRNLGLRLTLAYMFVYFVYQMSYNLILLITFTRSKLFNRTLPSGCDYPVTILIPCFNEEKTIKNTVLSVLASQLKEFEVIVLDDGSTDNSWKVLKDNFAQNPKVKLFRLQNGGKAKALNFGMAQSWHPFICCIDADTILEPDSLASILRHFSDPKVGAVAGNIQVGNAKDPLTMQQQIEYIRGQAYIRQGLQELNQVFVIPGATGVYRREVIMGLGGFEGDSLAEDTDLTLKVIAQGWKVAFERKGISYTEVPETWEGVIKQRLRWQYGTLQVCYKNLKYLFNPKGGMLGFFSIPLVLLENFFLPIVPLNAFFITLNVLVALNEKGIIAWSLLPDLGSSYAQFLTLYCLLSVVGSLLPILLGILNNPGKKPWHLLLYIPAYHLVFSVVLWAFQVAVVFKAIRGKPASWGSIPRTGRVAAMLSQAQTVSSNKTSLVLQTSMTRNNEEPSIGQF